MSSAVSLYTDLFVAYGGDLFEGCWLYDDGLALALLDWAKEHYPDWYAEAEGSSVCAENLIREEEGPEAMALFLTQLPISLKQPALTLLREEFETRDDLSKTLLAALNAEILAIVEVDALREDWLDTALRHEDNEDFDRAIAVYDKRLAVKPSEAQTFYRRGYCHASLADYDLAIADFTHAIHHAPDHAEAFLHRGRMYVFVGKESEALADIQRAIDLAPELRKKVRPETSILKKVIGALR